MIYGKRVTTEFADGGVSSDGGILVLCEVADGFVIVDQLAHAIGDTRHQSNVCHRYSIGKHTRQCNALHDGKDHDFLHYSEGVVFSYMNRSG